MDKLTKKITLTKYNIAKNELEIAHLYLSDTYNHVPNDLQYDIHTIQAMIAELAKTMQDIINTIENSGQPEKK